MTNLPPSTGGEAAVRLIRPDSLPWADLGAGGDLAEIKPTVTTEHSTTLGAGFCRFERCRFEWKLTYDECVHVLEGAMEVRHGDDVVRAGPGDVVFLAAGSDVVYDFPDRCLLFYAAYPVDWQERMEAADD